MLRRSGGSWRDEHGSDRDYVFRDNAELRKRGHALARLN
jgi:hypothetical protein